MSALPLTFDPGSVWSQDLSPLNVLRDNDLLRMMLQPRREQGEGRGGEGGQRVLTRLWVLCNRKHWTDISGLLPVLQCCVFEESLYSLSTCLFISLSVCMFCLSVSDWYFLRCNAPFAYGNYVNSSSLRCTSSANDIAIHYFLPHNGEDEVELNRYFMLLIATDATHGRK